MRRHRAAGGKTVEVVLRITASGQRAREGGGFDDLLFSLIYGFLNRDVDVSVQLLMGRRIVDQPRIEFAIEAAQ